MVEYIAGFFDGEGCITIKRNVSRNGSISHILRVGAVQCNPAPIYRIQAIYGGNICWRKATLRQRSTARWQIDCEKAARFLEDILPFLIVKRAEAELALEFHRTMNRSMFRPKLDPAISAMRENYKERLSALKRIDWLQ